MMSVGHAACPKKITGFSWFSFCCRSALYWIQFAWRLEGKGDHATNPDPNVTWPVRSSHDRPGGTSWVLPIKFVCACNVKVKVGDPEA